VIVTRIVDVVETCSQCTTRQGKPHIRLLSELPVEKMDGEQDARRLETTFQSKSQGNRFVCAERATRK
jgi:hypothetical protein